ncbi:MAG: TetR/AcrR family transcriptional regulator [Pseudomonadales bacterium]|nr:TetR/AcrR family transcriptional regulator [Pseudomonadales bacterium]MCP5330017.1 TetR/AcrR family transcriptional regulator [Pseudomonadales bacterium]MCP5343074.1 TetR/AcrR family transcriptional regulator [Pseudomonadales bacterium]
MKDSTGVRERLLQAALNCFLQDDYHQVSTRQIAAEAQVNVSMIRYYFGSKHGLYEEMLREQLNPMLEVLDGPLLSGTEGFSAYFRLYYDTMLARPEFPRLILKVLALNHAPGRRFIQQLLERGRLRGARRVEDLKRSGKLASDVDADILRLAFVSLAMTPMLLKSIFEEQMEIAMDEAFLARLAQFNGLLFSAGLAPQADEGENT